MIFLFTPLEKDTPTPVVNITGSDDGVLILQRGGTGMGIGNLKRDSLLYHVCLWDCGAVELWNCCKRG